MFTGLVQYCGTIESLSPKANGLTLCIESGPLTSEIKIGDSIATNGVCLTATVVHSKSFEVHAVSETLARTGLSDLRPGDSVNLEPALRMGDRLGGHFLQGHVDGRGCIDNIHVLGDGSWELGIEVPPEIKKYCIYKGSIGIDGISLTLAEVQNRGTGKSGRIKIAVIPHTLNATTLRKKKVGDWVNLEADLMGKYIEKLILPHASVSTSQARPKKPAGWGLF